MAFLCLSRQDERTFHKKLLKTDPDSWRFQKKMADTFDWYRKLILPEQHAQS